MKFLFLLFFFVLGAAALPKTAFRFRRITDYNQAFFGHGTGSRFNWAHCNGMSARPRIPEFEHRGANQNSMSIMPSWSGCFGLKNEDEFKKRWLTEAIGMRGKGSLHPKADTHNYPWCTHLFVNTMQRLHTHRGLFVLANLMQSEAPVRMKCNQQFAQPGKSAKEGLKGLWKSVGKSAAKFFVKKFLLKLFPPLSFGMFAVNTAAEAVSIMESYTESMSEMDARLLSNLCLKANDFHSSVLGDQADRATVRASLEGKCAGYDEFYKTHADKDQRWAKFCYCQLLNLNTPKLRAEAACLGKHQDVSQSLHGCCEYLSTQNVQYFRSRCNTVGSGLCDGARSTSKTCFGVYSMAHCNAKGRAFCATEFPGDIGAGVPQILADLAEKCKTCATNPQPNCNTHPEWSDAFGFCKKFTQTPIDIS